MHSKLAKLGVELGAHNWHKLSGALHISGLVNQSVPGQQLPNAKCGYHHQP